MLWKTLKFILLQVLSKKLPNYLSKTCKRTFARVVLKSLNSWCLIDKKLHERFPGSLFYQLGKFNLQFPRKPPAGHVLKLHCGKALSISTHNNENERTASLKVKIPFHEFRRELARKLSFLIKNFNAPKVAKSCANTFSSERW